MKRVMYRVYFVSLGLLSMTPSLANEGELEERRTLVQEARTTLEEARSRRDSTMLDMFQHKLSRIDRSCQQENNEKKENAFNVVIFTDAVELRLEALPIIDALRDKTFDLNNPPESYMTSWFIPTNLPVAVVNRHRRDMEVNAQRHEKLIHEKEMNDLYEAYKGRVSGAIYQIWQRNHKTNNESLNDFVRLTNRVNEVITNAAIREQLFAPIKKAGGNQKETLSR